QLARQVVTVDAERVERGVQALAVGDRRARRVTVRVVVSLVRDRFVGDAAPEFLAGLAVEAEHEELVVGRRRFGLLLEAGVLLGQVLGVGGAARVAGRQQEALLAPDDGRGGAAAGQGGLPLDVRLGVPLHRWVAARRRAVGQRPAPVRPVVERVVRGG